MALAADDCGTDMRKSNQCPCCKKEGEPSLKHLGADGLVYAGKVTEWKCGSCDMQWDSNEDFTCVICGQDVHGRFLVCGNPKCEKEFDDL